ncbi:hypothetical protein [Streptomyces tailanensis]|uniref:hypothetical protein n=1 Tax=Streptomyces tailanensis TaxID=2569858 RepID=UPI00122DC917|nr:hypothetical protein [Streptomyces tailanensis]
MQELERITARRSELDALAEELAKQLQEIQAEREELVIVEHVLTSRSLSLTVVGTRYVAKAVI